MNMYPSLQIKLLILIVSSWLVAASLPNDNKPLAAFTAKSLVRIEELADRRTLGRLLEIEESYDATRQLGRLTVLERGERSDLFVRQADKLYLEAHYRRDGSLAHCKTWTSRPDESYFGLFRDMLERRPEVAVDQQPDQTAHLIGPASLVYLFRQELQARWPTRLQAEMAKESDKAKLFDRRQVNPSEPPIQFSLDANNAKVVAFEQSGSFIERSNELAELAKFTTNDRLFIIDYLAIDQFDATTSPLDLFKLPSVFSCTGTGGDISMVKDEGGFNFEQVWPSRTPVRSGSFVGRSLSVIFHETDFHPEGVNLVIDSDRQMLKFVLDGHSENLVDLKRAIVYHLPVEPAANVDTKCDVLDPQGPPPSGLRNDQCSLLSIAQLLDGAHFNLEQSIWPILVGQTNLAIYLGATRFINGRPAHEFEFSYKSLNELPAFFRLLTDVGSWRQVADKKSSLLLGRLWLSIESCSELHSTIHCNGDPIVLGFRLESITFDEGEGQKVAMSSLVQVGQFLWDPLRGLGTADRLSDIAKCPLNKQRLSFETRWSAEAEVNSLSDERRFDDFVHLQLRESMKRAGVMLDIVRADKQALPGSMMATYSIELAEKPEQVSTFKLVEGGQISKDEMTSSLISRSKRIKTPFECLSWASQFGNARAVLYSMRPAECLVFETDDRRPPVRTAKEDLAPAMGGRKIVTMYSLYVRRIEKPSSTFSGGQTLKMFTSRKLRELNKILLNSKSKLKTDGSGLEASVQIGPLKVVPELTGERTNENRTTLLYKSGYRFLDLKTPVDETTASDGSLPSPDNESNRDVGTRAQTVSISFAQCMNKCEAEPLCASFAFCRYADLADSQYCQLANLKLNSPEVDKANEPDSLVGGQLTRDAGCEIHAKDYLQYYQQKSDEILLLEAGNNWHIDPEAQSLLDCASSCYTSPNQTCLRFSYCQGEARCLHWLTESLEESNEKPGQPTSVRESNKRLVVSSGYVNQREQVDGSLIGCSLFKRKPITLYHRTLTARSGSLRWTGEDLVESRLEHVNREGCAEKCLVEAECRSFDSCRIVAASTASHPVEPTEMGAITSQSNPPLVYRYDCILLSGSVFDNNMQLNEVAGDEQQQDKSNRATNAEQRSKVVEQTRCTHYEQLAAKRRLSPQRLELILQSLQANIGKAPTTSYPSSLFGAALLGLALGLGVRCLTAILRRRTSGAESI